MSVRMRHTRSHTKNRRSHHALTAQSIIKDEKSGSLRLPHRIDESTGMYRGKQIVTKREVKEKKKSHDERTHAHKHDHPEGERVPVQGDAKEGLKKEVLKKGGLLGRMNKGKAKARSGFGGGV